jgi:hypothetical protein
MRVPFAALALSSIASVVGCASRLPEPTAADAERARGLWQDASRTELDQGRSLLVDHCSGCHVVPLPRSHTPEQWPGLVEDMAEPAGLSRNEIQSVVRYLVVAAAPDRG